MRALGCKEGQGSCTSKAGKRAGLKDEIGCGVRGTEIIGIDTSVWTSISIYSKRNFISSF